MTKDSCGRCGRPIDAHQTIDVANVGRRCYPCFNEAMAEQMGVDFDNAVLQPVVVADARGVPHTFEIRSMLAATGHEMFATEIPRPGRGGYEFRILGDFESDAMDLFRLLYQKMRREMSERHVEKSEYGWRLTSGDRLVGRIEGDPDVDGTAPLVVVDGRAFTWEELGRMLTTYEGFTVRLSVEDGIEVVGGPLLEDAPPTPPDD
jgi:hypothetical protein